MGKGKPVILALLAATTLAGQDAAVADKGGIARNPAANPNVNLGLSAMPNSRTTVGLPAAAMAPKAGPGSKPFEGSDPGQSVGKGASAQMTAPGATRSASSAGLMPPGQSSQSNGGSGPGQSAGKGTSAQMDDPGANRSASSAGLAPPGQSNQSNQGASNDNKSDEAKGKLAASTVTARDVVSAPAVSLDQLPTCR